MIRYGPIPMDFTPPPLSDEERSRLCRLPSGGHLERNKRLSFIFNGRSYFGLEGDTLASALLANSIGLVQRGWLFSTLPAGLHNPNPIVEVMESGRVTSRVRMAELALFDGLVARPVQPHVGMLPADASPAIGVPLAWRKVRNFLSSHRLTPREQNTAPTATGGGPNAMHQAACDVLVVGGGIAGLSAALAAGSGGARVICVDKQTEMGGWLLASAETVDGLPANDWATKARMRLQTMPSVALFSRTMVTGSHARNVLTLLERRTERLPEGGNRMRECHWEVHAKQVVLATGAQEQAMLFPKSDLPGVMLASAVSMLIRRFAVRPGTEAVVYTSDDAGYDTALALLTAGAHVRVIDARAHPQGPLAARARLLGITTRTDQVLMEAVGSHALRAVKVRRRGANGGLAGPVEKLVCDLLAVSAGFSPVQPVQGTGRTAGACHGVMGLEACALDGHGIGLDAAMAAMARPMQTQGMV